MIPTLVDDTLAEDCGLKITAVLVDDMRAPVDGR